MYPLRMAVFQELTKTENEFGFDYKCPGILIFSIWVSGGGAQNLVFCTQSKLTLFRNGDMLSKGQQENGKQVNMTDPFEVRSTINKEES